MVWVARRKATILADYKFYSLGSADSSFQFVDCEGIGGMKLARDIRAGVIPIKHTSVVVAIGNAVLLDQFCNVPSAVSSILNALIERFGCVDQFITVMGLLPRPLADPDQVEVIKQQNRSLFKLVRSLVRQKSYPIRFIPVHKWFLKRMKNSDGSLEVEVDTFYYKPDTNILNQHGLVHLHLLLAGELKLRKIDYKWKGMPVVHRGVRRRHSTLEEGKRLTITVRETEDKTGRAKKLVKKRNVEEDSRLGSLSSSGSSSDMEPPVLVPIMDEEGE